MDHETENQPEEDLYNVRYVPEVAELFPAQGTWTESDYLLLPQSSRVIELANGMLTVNAPPEPAHQRIAGEIAIALDQHVVNSGVPGEVIYADVPVRLRRNLIRMPDVIFIRAQNLGTKRPMWVQGAPDWIAEVTSPDTVARDQREKLKDYALAGVPEYWLIEANPLAVRVYVLDTEANSSSYDPAGIYGVSDVAQSVTIPGFTLSVGTLA